MDRRWEFPWQVVRRSAGVVAVCCSHRTERAAGWCCGWRAFLETFRAVLGHRGMFDVRRNPDE